MDGPVDQRPSIRPIRATTPIPPRTAARSSRSVFTGRSIALVGPVGPTRGRAAVYVDGARIRVVDLRAGTFHPRQVLFKTHWRSSGTHKVELVVLGTKGRPHVAVDRIVIRR